MVYIQSIQINSSTRLGLISIKENRKKKKSFLKLIITTIWYKVIILLRVVKNQINLLCASSLFWTTGECTNLDIHYLQKNLLRLLLSNEQGTKINCSRSYSSRTCNLFLLKQRRLFLFYTVSPNLAHKS